MSAKYEHKKIEEKWQKKWEEAHAFAADENSAKKKLYMLDMFPYPSGAGIHLGHTENYTGTDIYSRFKRMQGYNVLHPMGWDAFGLPAENYAIKSGVPPQKTTDDAIDNFRKQIKSLGISYDWSREIGTHTPEYYKWTQWFFLFLYNNGLAEKRMAKVNWCPKDQTVLANEQTVSESGEKGVCVRCGTKVVQKDLEQWFFKITDFSDALIDDLDQVDWPESTKINQRNWIGRSEGAEIEFAVAGSEEKIKVFTTRPDTLFGATYVVLAPEHALVGKLIEQAKNKEEIEAYVEAAKNKTDLERQEEQKDKTGVEIKGVKAINPASKEEIPIFVADYVLGGYGTGAIMAVPAHDERDFAFAKKFNVPIRPVIAHSVVNANNPPREGKTDTEREVIHAIVRDQKNDTYLVGFLKDASWGDHKPVNFVIGGVEGGEDFRASAEREVREETGYTDLEFVEELGLEVVAKFFQAQKDVNRTSHVRTFLFNLRSEKREKVLEQEELKHEFKWVKRVEVEKLLNIPTDQLVWRFYQTGGFSYAGEGLLVNSGKFTGLSSEESKKKITEAVGGKWVKTYRLRDWLISRQRYWGAPIPVVYDPEGKPHPIPEEHLPWVLPTDVEFKPKGTSPLGQSKELLERTEKIFGKGWKPEIDTMDTFVCSSWYHLRFVDPKNEKEFASKEAIAKWLPVDLYVGGAEHTVLPLMYARFLTKALKKFGYVNFTEPFLKLRHQGTILAEDGSKMSKSKGNVVNPDDIIAQFGADALRLHIMFLGPFEAMKPWNTNNIMGILRFLERIWHLQDEVNDSPLGTDTRALMQATITSVSEDIENLKMNTAISALMIFSGHLKRIPLGVPREAFAILIQLLTPFAPHATNEIAESMAIDLTKWPLFDKSTVVSGNARIVVQVNGKLRSTIELPTGVGEAEALAAARSDAGVAKWLALGKEEKAVYVAGKIINFVIR